MLSYKEVSIVIVSYKSKKKILKFLEKISNYKKIIIIENSNDFDFKQELSKVYQNVEIYFPNNIGYGSSANFARKKLNTEYFFLFNPDLEGVDPFLIEYFLEYGKKLNNQFSCLGPRYKNINKKTLKQSNTNEEIGSIKAISGAAMFFNCNKFDLIGGFDENFFLYFEETDYCKRGRKINLKPYQLNKMIIGHNVGTAVEFETDEEKNKIKKLCSWHFIWSKYYFYKKNYGNLLSIFLFLPIIFRSVLKIIISYVFNNQNNLEKYKIRINGLTNSILGKKSYKRIDHF